MPTYEYKCDKCEDVYEVRQSFHDDPITDCPSGDGGNVKKIFSTVGIVFKGSGFYKNDSRSASGSKKSSTTATESKSDSKSDTKSESKSEKKSEKKSDSGKSSSSSTSAA